MTHTDLKPCPFCGGADIRIIVNGPQYFGFCYGCGMETAALPTKRETITAWNTRARTPDTAPSQSADLIAEAEAYFMLEYADQQGLQDQFIVRDLITALRAAEQWVGILQSDLEAAEAKRANARKTLHDVMADNERLREALTEIERDTGDGHAKFIARRALGGEP